MENSLEAFYYMARAFINFLLQVEISGDITIGGVLLANVLIMAVFGAIGLIAPGVLRFGPDRPALEDRIPRLKGPY